MHARIVENFKLYNFHFYRKTSSIFENLHFISFLKAFFKIVQFMLKSILKINNHLKADPELH